MTILRIHHARGPIRIVSVADERGLDDAIRAYSLEYGVARGECVMTECAA